MTSHYVDASGHYKGGYEEGYPIDDPTWVNLGDNPPPVDASQVWDFIKEDWGPSLWNPPEVLPQTPEEV